MQHGAVVWLTGLSGAGKTTVAGRLSDLLRACGTRPVLLDGDRIRAAVPAPLGYTSADRRRLGGCYSRLALEFAGQGHLVVCATISLFDDLHRWNREHLPNYVEVLLRVPEAELRRRNSKGVYDADRTHVAGLDLPVQFPRSPDLVLDNAGVTTPDLAAAAVLHALVEKDLI